MNGLQVAAGLALLCLIAWLCFIGRTQVVTPRETRRPLPPDVFHAIRDILPGGWTIINTPVGAIVYLNATPWFYVYTRFSVPPGGTYPETTLVLDRDGQTVATTWALSGVAPQLIAAHTLSAIKRELQHHDEIS